MAIYSDSGFETGRDLPSIRPTLDLNFAATKTLDRRITFTRDSIGTYTDELGIIRTVPNNVPRFDHDPETGESLGLLIEEQRTNLFTFSAFPQSTTTSFPSFWAGWNPATFLTSQTLSPDGVAYGIFHGSVNTNGGGLRREMTGLTPGGTYYVTYYVKGLTAEELTYFTNNNAIGTTTGTANGAANVAWFAATKVQFACNNLNGTGASGSYQTTLTTEWQRFGGVVIADSAGSARIIIGNNVGDVGTGDEDGGGTWMIWGAQLELGSFPTSYIPTSGSTVTRNKDIAVIKGTNFTDVFDTNFKEFSLLVDYDNSKTNDGTYYEIINFWGESTGFDDRIGIQKDDQSPYHIETRAFGGGGGIFNNGLLSASSKAATQKFATSWSVPDYSNTTSRRWAFCFSGETPIDVVNDGGGTTVPAITRLGLGINPTRLVETETGGLIHFKRFAAYNKALTDTQLQSLTS